MWPPGRGGPNPAALHGGSAATGVSLGVSTGSWCPGQRLQGLPSALLPFLPFSLRMTLLGAVEFQSGRPLGRQPVGGPQAVGELPSLPWKSHVSFSFSFSQSFPSSRPPSRD